MEKVLFLTGLPKKLDRIGILVNVVAFILIVITIFGIKVPVFIHGRLVDAKKKDHGITLWFCSLDGAKDFSGNNETILLRTYEKDQKRRAKVITSSIENDTLKIELFMENSATLLKSLNAYQEKQARLMIDKKPLAFTLFHLD
ncbi:hypothetical protein [Olivibacter sp. XZL3]|uniref:hypothetical protein n=1 Tax=Olivibacter sp. XZL3 TaxID=1735116 RepID=UPI0010655007|nr:hypothetical protein [Olivibacter sp. XZL3]